MALSQEIRHFQLEAVAIVGRRGGLAQQEVDPGEALINGRQLASEIEECEQTSRCGVRSVPSVGASGGYRGDGRAA